MDGGPDEYFTHNRGIGVACRRHNKFIAASCSDQPPRLGVLRARSTAMNVCGPESEDQVPIPGTAADTQVNEAGAQAPQAGLIPSKKRR